MGKSLVSCFFETQCSLISVIIIIVSCTAIHGARCGLLQMHFCARLGAGLDRELNKMPSGGEGLTRVS